MYQKSQLSIAFPKIYLKTYIDTTWKRQSFKCRWHVMVIRRFETPSENPSPQKSSKQHWKELSKIYPGFSSDFNTINPLLISFSNKVVTWFNLIYANFKEVPLVKFTNILKYYIAECYLSVPSLVFFVSHLRFSYRRLKVDWIHFHRLELLQLLHFGLWLHPYFGHMQWGFEAVLDLYCEVVQQAGDHLLLGFYHLAKKIPTLCCILYSSTTNPMVNMVTPLLIQNYTSISGKNFTVTEGSEQNHKVY